MIIEGTDGAVVIIFGTGDIGVIEGYPEGNPELSAVEFMQAPNNNPIGIELKDLSEYTKRGCTTEELGYEGYCPGVRFVFDKPESIDVVIDALQKAKSRLEPK